MGTPSLHTPAPWHCDQSADEFTIYADNDWPIARLLEHGDRKNAQLIAATPDLLAALSNVRALIAEAAMTGFNWKDGDWAERLFASQQVTSAAIEKALGNTRKAICSA